MPHVLDDTEIQEYSSPTAEYDALHERVRALPSSRPGHVTLFTSLRRLLMSRWHVHPTQAQAHFLTPPQEPETSMDTLARKYPDIYLRITSWSS
jgi:hypothetical protein